jgi:hypothetical protein
MFKRLVLVACSFLLLSFISTSLKVEALTFEKLPIVQKSNQWSVQVGEAEKGKDLAKPVKGKFHTYSLNIERIGTNVDSVYINLYRNEPNSIRKFGLQSCPPEMECNKNLYETAVDLAKNMNMGLSYKHNNFLLDEKATELEVEIIWTENNNGRPLKETFTFTNN